MNPIDRARLRLTRQDDEMFMPPGLPYFLSLEVVDYAEEMVKQIAILKQQAADTTAARYEDARLFNVNLAQIAGLQAANRRLRWKLRGVVVAAGFCIVGLLIALWSCRAAT
jgi:hypothetical protein